MTPQQIAEITRVVEAYKQKKFEMMKKVKDLEDFCNQGRIFPWHRDTQIEQLWNDLVATSERKEFVDYAERTNTDVEFEKHFRTAHSLAFLNHPLDPKKL
jgi:hypothetical protein